MIILTVSDVRQLVAKVSLKEIFARINKYLTEDFTKWEDFQKSPRHATHYTHGVIELMPTANDQYYAFKYVNGHPINPSRNKSTVMATGQLSDVETGEPLLYSEMTLTTAIRTAGASALAAQYMLKKNSKTMAMIGTGGQSEFQALALHLISGMDNVRYYDPDGNAMKKFKANMSGFGLNLKACSSVDEAIDGADCVTTITATKNKHEVLLKKHAVPGMFINAVGGDCPGKTELDPAILDISRVIVEYTPQTLIEGEIQNRGRGVVSAELWQVVKGEEAGRINDQEITLFDSVGFAIEDFSMLRLLYDLAREHKIGHEMDMIPTFSDPKNIFSQFVK